MNDAEVQRANKARGLSRKRHDGFVVKQRRIKDMRVRFGARDLRSAFVVEFETPYGIDTQIMPKAGHIANILTNRAEDGVYDGGMSPVLHDLSFSTPRHGNYWLAIAVYDKEWVDKK